MRRQHTDSFETRVESFEGKLTSADRDLISVILRDPAEAVYMSSTDLASRAAVHASTVVRLARKLGFDGFPDMRGKLRQDAEVKSRAAALNRQRVDRIERGSTLADLIESEMAAIAAVANTVTQLQIDHAVDLLAESRTTYIVGRGSAAPLVTHFERRLRRSGLRCSVALNMQRRDLAEYLIGMEKGDTIVVFGFQAPDSLPSGFAALIESAAEIGVHTIAVGDATILTARPKPEMVFSVSRPDEGVMQLRSGAMVVCEALAIALAHRKSEHAVRGLKSLEKLRNRFLETKGTE